MIRTCKCACGKSRLDPKHYGPPKAFRKNRSKSTHTREECVFTKGLRAHRLLEIAKNLGRKIDADIAWRKLEPISVKDL